MAIPATLQHRIEEAIEEASWDALNDVPPGPRLERALERNVIGVMERFRQRGELIRYQVRCQAQIQDDMGGGVIIEVAIQLPKRVEQLIVSMRLGGGPKR